MSGSTEQGPRLPPAARWLLNQLLPAEFARSLADEIVEGARRKFPETERRSLPSRFWMWRQVASPGTFRLRRTLARRRESGAPIGFFELRMAFRGVRSTAAGPAVVVALAGATFATAVAMSFVRAVLLSPLPFPDVAQLAVVFSSPSPGQTAKFNSNSWDDYEAFRDSSESFTGIAAQLGFPFTLIGESSADPVGGLRVTPHYFSMLGAHAAFGRLLRAEDHSADAARVVVLSHRTWRVRFGSRPDVVGERIRLEDMNRAGVAPSPEAHEYTVIGVTEDGFWAPRFWNDAYNVAELWVPLRESHDVVDRQMGVLDIVAQLAPGTGPVAAQAELRALQTNAPDYDPADPPRTVVRGVEEQIVGASRGALWQLMLSSIVLVAVACANTGIVLGTRALRRGPEFATLAALGAPSRRLCGLVIAEALIMAMGAVVLGTTAARWFLPTIVASVPFDVPRLDEVGLTLTDAAAAAGGTLLVVGVFAILPTWTAVRRRVVAPGVKPRRTRASAGRLLVSVQVALSAVLLIGTLSSLRTFSGLEQRPLGFSVENRFVIDLWLPPSRYPDAAARNEFVDAVQATLAEVQQVEALTLAQNAPLDLAWSVEFARDRVDPVVGLRNAVAGNYHSVLDVPVIDGRALDDSDRASGEPVVALNRLAAEILFQADAVGREITVNGQPRTVVGVVENTAGSALGRTVPTAYLPIRQMNSGIYSLILQTAQPLDRAGLDRVRQAIAAVDAQLPLLQPRRLADHVDRYLAGARFVLVGLAILASVALVIVVLGALGVAGVEATSRVREIAIRQAVGATPGRVLVHLLTRPAASLLVGAVVGAVLASALGRVTPGGDARALDLVLAGACVVGVTLAASWARFDRATRANPAELLRK